MGHSVAIIEDDLAILQMYQLKFESAGFTVKTAVNGALGLELLEHFKPDLVLLDLMMPEMNGDEMLAKLRKTTWGKKARVLVLTNVGEQELPKSLAKLDVDEVIPKAYHTPAQVVEKANRLLLPQ
jgi:two-component system response regulator AdeR